MSKKERIGEPETVIRLKRVHCSETGEPGKDGDDLYIRYYINGDSRDHRYPEASHTSGRGDIHAGEDWNLDFDIRFTTSVRIELWDNDTGDNDNLGYVNYLPADAAEDNLVRDTNSTRTGQYQFITGPGPS